MIQLLISELLVVENPAKVKWEPKTADSNTVS